MPKWIFQKTSGDQQGVRALKTLYFYKKKINKLKGILQEIIKKNTWNIRCLVDETIVPSTQHIILKIVGFQALAALPSVAALINI